MFIDSFIGYLKAERNYSAHTLRAYGTDLRAFEEYLSAVDGSFSFVDVDADIVRAWVASLMEEGAAAASVNRKLSTLRTFFSFLRNEGVVAANPVSELQGPKRSRHLPTFVKEGDMDELIDNGDFGEGFAAVRDRVIVLSLYTAGMRLSELVGLNLKDVDVDSGQLKVFGKRSRHRIIPFASELKEAFKEYIALRVQVASPGEEAFFVSDRGIRVNSSYIYRMVNRMLATVSSVGKRSPHVLRHTFATAMLNNDAELGAVKELLGHRRLSTTEVYTHLTFEELKKFYKKAHPRAGNI